MHARNEVVPLAPAPAAGPVAQAVPSSPRPAAPLAALDKVEANASLNAEMASAQERRARLVQAQRRDTAFQLFYALFGVALMVVQLEYLWFANAEALPASCPVDARSGCAQCLSALRAAGRSVPLRDGRMILNALRVLLSCSTALLLYYTCRFYASEVEVMKIKNIVPPKATLLSSSLRARLVLELAVLAVHPFPGIEGLDPRWPSLLVAASLLMFARVALVLRVVQFRHAFNSSNGWFIGALTNVDFTLAFFLKSTLKNHPTRCILAFLLALLGVGGYALFVVERFLCAFVAGSCCQPMSLADAVWALIVTVLTIGYGDVVPRTLPGRALAVVAGASGMVATAVTIAVMSQYLVLTRSEHKVNAFLKKDENRRLLNDHAARAIQAFMQLRASQGRPHVKGGGGGATGGGGGGGGGATTSIAGMHGSSSSLSHHHHGGPSALMGKARAAAQRRAESKLFAVLRAYRQAKRHVTSQDVSDPMDKQLTMLEMMEVNVEYIRTKIEDLTKSLHAASLLHHGALGGTSTSNSNSNRSRRRLPGVTPSASPSASLPAPSASTPSLSHHTQSQSQQQQQQQQQQASPTTSTIQEADEAPGEDASNRHRPTHPRYASHVPGPPGSLAGPDSSSSFERLSDVYTPQPQPQEPHRGPTLPTSAPSTLLAHYGGGAALEGVPEWAILLESSLQQLLGQVAQVAAEVDAVKSRVHQHMESVDAKLVDLERRIVVGDALRVIARSKTSRMLAKHDAADAGSGHAPHQAGSCDPATIAALASAAAMAAAAGNATPPSGNSNSLLPRFRRMASGGSSSHGSRRPSVHNFVTQKDLDEFHSADSLHG